MFEIFDSTPVVAKLEDFFAGLLKLVRAFLALLGVELPSE